MPRPGPYKAPPKRILRRHRLSDKARSKLIDLLGYSASPPTSTGEMILDVENVLGICVSDAEHPDRTPRPAHYVNEFRPIERQARKLSQLLLEMDQYFSEQLSTRNLHPDSIAADLVKLARASKDVIEDFKARPSTGAPKNAVLCAAIRELRHIFRNKYQGVRTGRTRRGAFQFSAEEEKRELAFVEAALLDARIIRVGFRELPRLFLDTRCTLPEDRERVLERMANKIHSGYERENTPPKPGR